MVPCMREVPAEWPADIFHWLADCPAQPAVTDRLQGELAEVAVWGIRCARPHGHASSECVWPCSGSRRGGRWRRA
jgi:hypothetical protein